MLCFNQYQWFKLPYSDISCPRCYALILLLRLHPTKPGVISLVLHIAPLSALAFRPSTNYTLWYFFSLSGKALYFFNILSNPSSPPLSTSILGPYDTRTK